MVAIAPLLAGYGRLGAVHLGRHPKAIQERLGHSSITVTLDRYGHLLPGLDSAEDLDELGDLLTTAAAI